MATPSYKVKDLIPPVREHTFAPEVDPAGPIDEQAKFIAVNGLDWSNPASNQQRAVNRRGRSDDHLHGLVKAL